MKSRLLFSSLLVLIFSMSLFAEDGFELWQLHSQTPAQMNSYVIKTANKKIIVIDGGMTGDAPYLRGFLGVLGNRVDHWFITHPHPDHADACIEIMNSPDGITIEKIYGTLPDEKWVAEHEFEYLSIIQNLNKSLEKCKKSIEVPTLGQIIKIDNIDVEILSVFNPEITQNALNNSSLVIKMSDECKSVLFLGDLGVRGGQKLLQSPLADRLKSDYVQMAHHGQRGVNREFYEKVQAKYALWPTPLWLWENDNGEGKDSGPWETLKVREWMKELGVKKNYVSAFGLMKIPVGKDISDE